MAKSSKSQAMKFLEDVSGGPLTFGMLLETIRHTDDYTLDALAKKLGVSRSHLCDVEKGRRGVGPERAAKWAKVLGYNQAQFIALSLQAAIDAAGLKYRVELKAA